jgi:transposase
MGRRGTAEQLEERRRLAVRRVSEGVPKKQVAAVLGVSDRAVRMWVAAHRAGGDDGLKAKPHPGRKPFLTSAQEQAVLGWLAEKPTAHGFRTDLWTARRVADLIRCRLGIRFHPSYLREWLTKRGYTPQKPARWARERKPEAIARWLAEDWPRIQATAAATHAHVALIDETGVFLNPLVRRTWAKRGRTPVLDSWGRHRDKVSVIGAVTVSPVAQRLGLYFATDPKDYFNAERVVRFLRDLLRHLRGKVIVVWDRGSNHKGPAVRKFLARNERLSLEYLPAYAPDLNPVEAVWSWLKYGKLLNFVPEDVRDLDDWVIEYLVPLKCDPHLLKRLWAGSELPVPVGSRQSADQ